MATALPALTPVEETLYVTLAGRALDSRSRFSVLGDTLSDEIALKIGYNPDDIVVPRAKAADVAMRSKMLDDVVRGFIARHPDAVVLDLGAGLDTRVVRVAPPETVDWYDVDLPGVVQVREQVLPPHANVHAVAADVTDPGWLEALPGDRAAVVVSDGLLPFLTEAEFAALLNRLTDHFPGGEVAFNNYPRYAVRILKRMRSTRALGALVRHGGFDDPHEPERWDPDLTLIDEMLAARLPAPPGTPMVYRLANRLIGLSPALARKFTAIDRYRV
ncbi:MAG: class I SAM-dependent methyltransferase [Nonomuraea sp.]|nr:class I SAM-dependent methyltransferase [Nonomuraea sp.]